MDKPNVANVGGNPQFRVGDVVRLRSSGPQMVVESVQSLNGRDTVRCAWFPRGDDSKPVGSTFFPETLELCTQYKATAKVS